jgi:hypothetical protein
MFVEMTPDLAVSYVRQKLNFLTLLNARDLIRYGYTGQELFLYCV